MDAPSFPSNNSSYSSTDLSVKVGIEEEAYKAISINRADFLALTPIARSTTRVHCISRKKSERFTTSKTASSVKRMNTVLTSLFQVLVIHENIRSLILAEDTLSPTSSSMQTSYSSEFIATPPLSRSYTMLPLTSVSSSRLDSDESIFMDSSTANSCSICSSSSDSTGSSSSSSTGSSSSDSTGSSSSSSSSSSTDSSSSSSTDSSSISSGSSSVTSSSSTGSSSSDSTGSSSSSSTASSSSDSTGSSSSSSTASSSSDSTGSSSSSSTASSSSDSTVSSSSSSTGSSSSDITGSSSSSSTDSSSSSSTDSSSISSGSSSVTSSKFSSSTSASSSSLTSTTLRDVNEYTPTPAFSIRASSSTCEDPEILIEYLEQALAQDHISRRKRRKTGSSNVHNERFRAFFINLATKSLSSPDNKDFSMGKQMSNSRRIRTGNLFLKKMMRSLKKRRYSEI
ncbi:uncharacterized protein [Acropora muricata]|uniref:uncharacterized protein isoform X2 n=1 Tax=Acropora muricata TaxID=159855 RepID=UPI0034E3D3DF